MLKELMGEQGLERTIGDEGCYILRSEGHIICQIATHVDDCLVTAKTREILDKRKYISPFSVSSFI
jgi:hypothetical protein